MLSKHVDCKVTEVTFGNEGNSLLVIDGLVKNPEKLVGYATEANFTEAGTFYPGLIAAAEKEYSEFIINEFSDIFLDFFNLSGSSLNFERCTYSLLTVPPENLMMRQRIPHYDSTSSNHLAMVHYLFKGDLGGTSFYRHRESGFESIPAYKEQLYYDLLGKENSGSNLPNAEYINGNTPLFEKTHEQTAVFNRAVVYRQNVLHSGSIDKHFQADTNPASGRLTLNSFIQAV